MPPEWLPDTILLNAHGGDWGRYLDAIYEVFRTDFVGVNLKFKGKRVGLKKHPIIEGREATFWHFISEGKIEAERTPDLRRCERIGWPRAIIDNCDDAHLKTWLESVNGSDRIHLWCESAEYLLVIADRGDYVLPWTGFPVTRLHQQQKLARRWAQYR